MAPDGALVAPDLAELHEIRWVPWDEVDALLPDHGLRRALAKARAIVQTYGSEPEPRQLATGDSRRATKASSQPRSR